MLYRRCTDILSQIGMNPKEKGYYYCRQAIWHILLRRDRPKIFEIYDEVAREYGTTRACVERNIRYCVERTWEKGNIDSIYEFFGYTVSPEKGKPTNSEFLFLIADRISMNINAG